MTSRSEDFQIPASSQVRRARQEVLPEPGQACKLCAEPVGGKHKITCPANGKQTGTGVRLAVKPEQCMIFTHVST